MALGMIGLGRMGANMSERLVKGGHRVVGYDRSPDAVQLVVAKGALLVFCEVKTRTSAGYGAAAEAVTPKKQRRIRLLAIGWLKTHPEVRPNVVRFDVAAITGIDVSIVVSAF